MVTFILNSLLMKKMGTKYCLMYVFRNILVRMAYQIGFLIPASPVASLFKILRNSNNAFLHFAKKPIPKTSVPSDITTGLCPISLTPILSKICETFVSDCMIPSIMNKIDRRQFGSIKKSSLTHYFISLVHNLSKETHLSKCAVRVFPLDFSKAFDLTDHNILLHKLSELNVPLTIFNWVQSFFQLNGNNV